MLNLFTRVRHRFLSLCAQINGIDWHEGASFVVVFGPLIIAVINFVQATAPPSPSRVTFVLIIIVIIQEKEINKRIVSWIDVAACALKTA